MKIWGNGREHWLRPKSIDRAKRARRQLKQLLAVDIPSAQEANRRKKVGEIWDGFAVQTRIALLESLMEKGK